MIRSNYNITFLQQMLGISSPMSPMSKLSVSSLSSPEVQNQLKAAGIDVNSRQYQAVMKDMMGALDGRAGYTTVSAIKNRMRQYNADGDYVGPGGIVVPGMIATGIPESERHQIINVSEDARQKMFDETKRHFLQDRKSVV